MTVRDLLERLVSHAFDGRGPSEAVMVLCDGVMRPVAGVETRLVPNGDDRPRPTFVLLVADAE